MRYLKRFNENIELDKITDEINAISFILEDEGYKISIKPVFAEIQVGNLKNIFTVNIEYVGSSKDAWSRSDNRFYTYGAREMSLLADASFYDEYVNRIEEICYKHGFEIFQRHFSYLAIAQRKNNLNENYSDTYIKIKDELDNIKFILEDDNIEFNIMDHDQGMPFNLTYYVAKVILIDKSQSQEYSHAARNVVYKESYLEWLDRANEIIGNYNAVLRTNAFGQNYLNFFIVRK